MDGIGGYGSTPGPVLLVLGGSLAYSRLRRAPERAGAPNRHAWTAIALNACANVALACSLSGCAWGLHEDALRTRAAFDFQCQEDKIVLTQLAPGHGTGADAIMGAQGCGHRATYVQAKLGTWIMNTASGNPSVDDPGPSSTAPAAPANK